MNGIALRPRRLERYAGTATIRRIALADDDVARGTVLPYFDLAFKSADFRHQWFAERYVRRCWELNAMAPVSLRDRVESWISAHLPIDAWEHAVGFEAAEIESMRLSMVAWNSSKSGEALKYPGGPA